MPSDRVSTAIRLPPELHRRLADEADARDVSLNWLMVRLLARGVEQLADPAAALAQNPVEATDD